MTPKHHLILLSVITIWGINFLFMKFALDDIPPMVLGLLRFVGVLMPAVLFIKPPKVAWHLLALYGLSISFGQFGLVFLALSWDFPSGLVALILQVQVFLTVLFASIFLKEPVRANHLLGMLTAGLGLILIGVGQYQGRLPLVSMLPVLGAGLSWACGNIIVKKIGQVDALSLVVWGNVSSLVAFLLGSLALYGAGGLITHIGNLSALGWVGVAFLAYVSSLVGYTGFGYLLARHSAGRVTPFILLVPVIALIAGMVVLGERLGVWHWAGIFVVMAGLGVHMFGGRLIKGKI